MSRTPGEGVRKRHQVRTRIRTKWIIRRFFVNVVGSRTIPTIPIMKSLNSDQSHVNLYFNTTMSISLDTLDVDWDDFPEYDIDEDVEEEDHDLFGDSDKQLLNKLPEYDSSSGTLYLSSIHPQKNTSYYALRFRRVICVGFYAACLSDIHCRHFKTIPRVIPRLAFGGGTIKFSNGIAFHVWTTNVCTFNQSDCFPPFYWVQGHCSSHHVYC